MSSTGVTGGPYLTFDLISVCIFSADASVWDTFTFTDMQDGVKVKNVTAPPAGWLLFDLCSVGGLLGGFIFTLT